MNDGPAGSGTAADAAAIASETPAAGAPAAGTPAPASATPVPAAGTPAPPAGAPAPVEWTAPKNKEEHDKMIKEAVEAGMPKLPDKYELKLPDDIEVDPAVVDRTATIARELGLSQDNAQKALGFVVQEAVAQTAAKLDQMVKDHQPGGAEWQKTEQKWKDQSLKDPYLGGNNPQVFEQNQKLAERVAARYGDEELVKMLRDDPMGSHPAVLRFLVRIGKASKESDLVKPTSTAPAGEKSREEVIKDWYPNSPEMAKAPA